MSFSDEKNTIEYKLQDAQYRFPYHYIPNWSANITLENKWPEMEKKLRWGFEYLSYMSKVVDFVTEVMPSSILDVGCGDGRLIELLSKSVVYKKINRVKGIDISRSAIEFAKLLNPELGGVFYELDIADITEHYDCVTCIETLEHIPNEMIKRMVSNLFRILQVDGYLIISVPTTNRPKAGKHFRHYDLDVLKEQLDLASIDYEIERVEYTWKANGLKKYLRFTDNRLWYFRVHKLDTWLYNRYKKATAENGMHLITVIRKRGN